MRRIRARFWILAGLILLVVALFAIPQIRERVFTKFDELRVQVRAALFPVQEQAFVPGGARLATVTPDLPTSTSTPLPPTLTSTITPLTPLPTFTATPTATALPAAISLKGVKWETQNGNWNYCGPTNLSMLLSFWGWKGTKLDTGKVLKPFEYDLNVMPYEMVDYVQQNTSLGVVLRVGGTLPLLKTLLANGFPVLLEKGVYFHETASGQVTWMGHYTVVTGYDDQKANFITQDSFVQPDLLISYSQIEQEWRSFNYVFLVAYPHDKENQVMSLLGDNADETNAYKIAYERASLEAVKQTGIEQYFAWFNRGSSQVKLQDYAGAAESFDQAFKIYPTIPEDKRPWRMMWYQTGPYFAYYYTGRYQDVIDLATNTLEFIRKRAEALGISKMPYVGPFIEESWYWRGLARLVVGDNKGAADDFKTAVKYHPGFQPAVDQLKKLGIVAN